MVPCEKEALMRMYSCWHILAERTGLKRIDGEGLWLRRALRLEWNKLIYKENSKYLSVLMMYWEVNLADNVLLES